MKYYHWSPSYNRESILSQGLVRGVYKSADGYDFVAKYVCLSSSPFWAWTLTKNFRSISSEWDCYEVTIPPGARRTNRLKEGIDEYRVYKNIPPVRIKLVATTIIHGESK